MFCLIKLHSFALNPKRNAKENGKKAKRKKKYDTKQNENVIKVRVSEWEMGGVR